MRESWSCSAPGIYSSTTGLFCSAPGLFCFALGLSSSSPALLMGSTHVLLGCLLYSWALLLCSWVFLFCSWARKLIEAANARSCCYAKQTWSAASGHLRTYLNKSRWQLLGIPTLLSDSIMLACCPIFAILKTAAPWEPALYILYYTSYETVHGERYFREFRCWDFGILQKNRKKRYWIYMDL